MFMRNALSPILAAALLAGCVTTQEDTPIVDALPTADSVQIKLPEATARSVGQLAEYYVLTRQVTRDLNAGAAWVLLVVHAVVQFPATTVEDNVYTWGPWSDGALAPAEWQLVVTANDDGTYDWELEGRSKTTPEDGFLAVISGHAIPGDEPHRGSGDFTFDYAYAESADGSGDFQFALDSDFEENGSASEQALIRSRWLDDGEGRADALLSGGDLGGIEVQASECWDEQFRRSYYTDSVGYQATEGDAGSCAFDDVAMPEF